MALQANAKGFVALINSRWRNRMRVPKEAHLRRTVLEALTETDRQELER